MILVIAIWAILLFNPIQSNPSDTLEYSDSYSISSLQAYNTSYEDVQANGFAVNTIDGYDWQLNKYGTNPLGFKSVLSNYNGIKYLSNLAGYYDINQSINIYDIARVNEKSRKGIEINYLVGNESGDPGPWLYSEKITPNVDRKGPDFNASFLSYKNPANYFRTNIILSRYAVDDIWLIKRLKYISHNEEKKEYHQPSRVIYTWKNDISKELSFAELMFISSISYKRSFLFIREIANELPYDSKQALIGFGAKDIFLSEQIKPYFSLSYQLDDSDSRYNAFDYSYHLKRTLYNYDIGLKLFKNFGLGIEKTAIQYASATNQIDAEILKMYIDYNIQKESFDYSLKGVQKYNLNASYYDLESTLRYKINNEQSIILDYNYYNRFAFEQDEWIWLRTKDIFRDIKSVESSHELNTTKEQNFRIKFRQENNSTFLEWGLYHNIFDQLNTMNIDFDFIDEFETNSKYYSLETKSAIIEQLSKFSNSGLFLSYKENDINLYKNYGKVDIKLFLQVEKTNGLSQEKKIWDDAKRRFFSSLDILLKLRNHPLKYRIRTSVQSKRYYPLFRVIDGRLEGPNYTVADKFAAVYRNRLANYIKLDFEAIKEIKRWDTSLSIKLENINRAEVQYHPIGAEERFSIYVSIKKRIPIH